MTGERYSYPRCHLCGVGVQNDPLIRKAVSMFRDPPPVFCASCRAFPTPGLDAAGWPLRDARDAEP